MASLPPKATLRATPFNVSFPNTAVEEMKLLIKASKLAPETYESSFSDRRYGVTREWMINAKRHWENNFDWRKTEEYINSYSNYTAPIVDDDGKIYTVHFVALFSEKADAVPLIMLHGWPGSFLEFLPLIDRLRKSYKPSELPYHVIVPSLPGYTFSSGPPLDKDLVLEDVARIINKLAVGLGFGDGYVAQGGDVGSGVSRILGTTYPNCKAVHLNMDMIQEPEGVSKSYSPLETEALSRLGNFLTQGMAYALEHGTRPSTVGFVLASNPIALLAWIGEKMLAWSDTDLPLEFILNSVSLYWLTETFPRSIYPYRQFISSRRPHQYLKKPLGFSWFPKDVGNIPREWIATTGNLVFFREHTEGGHFAALEKPEALLKDVEDFIAQVWDEAKKQ